jgi:hypothetical protein
MAGGGGVIIAPIARYMHEIAHAIRESPLEFQKGLGSSRQDRPMVNYAFLV